MKRKNEPRRVDSIILNFPTLDKNSPGLDWYGFERRTGDEPLVPLVPFVPFVPLVPLVP